jgi:hypothetical protein
MGEGTSGVAATKLGRKFIGIEIDSDRFDVAKGYRRHLLLKPFRATVTLRQLLKEVHSVLSTDRTMNIELRVIDLHLLACPYSIF